MSSSYLLSSPTLPGALSMPPIGGIGHPSTRMVLPGSRNPQSFPVFSKDPDPMIFAEILEFALSLTPPPKGQEPFAGLPHLQAYRFVRASALAELGYISETTRYLSPPAGNGRFTHRSLGIARLSQLLWPSSHPISMRPSSNL